MVSYAMGWSHKNLTVAASGSSIYNESSPLFVTPVKMSYKCNKEETVTLTNAVDNSTATFVFAHAQLQAFRTDNATNFSDGKSFGYTSAGVVPRSSCNTISDFEGVHIF